MAEIKKLSKQAGFTIAEMAIVITIGGIVLAIMGSKFLDYVEQKKIDSTLYKIEVIQDAIGKHLQEIGRYPCPAALTIQPTQPAYNREVAPGTCETAGFIAGTFLRPGARTVCFSNCGADTETYTIRIGGVPVRSLNLPDEFAIDAWGNRITYAVSANLASATPDPNPNRDGFAPDRGVIAITGFNDGVNPPVSLVNPAGSAHYVIVSHGSDKGGARSFEGTGLASPCNLDAANNPIDQDGYNCDYTPGGVSPQFVKTLVDDTAFNTINYFNDFVAFREEIRQARFEFPSNAVMGFNRTTCPEGWSIFPEGIGRYIMGAAQDNLTTLLVDESEITRNQHSANIDTILNPNAVRNHNNVGVSGHLPNRVVPYHTTVLYCQKN